MHASTTRLFRLLLAANLLTAVFPTLEAKDYTVTSPDGRLSAVVSDGESLSIDVRTDGRSIVHLSDIALANSDSKVRSCRKTTVRQNIDAPFYRQRHFTAEAAQIDLRLADGFGLQVRAYDEGVAYRFYTTRRGLTTIANETVRFTFPDDALAWLSYSTNKEKPFAMAFQNTYHATPLKAAQATPAFLPATVGTGNVKVTILESDLRSYPGMFLQHKDGCLEALFAPYPKTMDRYRWRGMTYVKEAEDFIARSEGPRTYPWRVMAVSHDDTEMPVNNLVYALAEPNKIGDTSWIKPGKVAWDWWHDWNLRGVSFKAGINTDTYLYYIDFAAKNGIPYIVLDEGWYDSNRGDLMHPIADIDLQRLISYGRERGVSIVLWTVFNVLDEHLDEACRHYSEMGIKGFKVDFLDRNDQTAVEMAERLARVAAKHHLVLDYHGFYCPTGMSRTYPNILNYEGVFGMEECRWAKKTTDMPLYDVTFPFIRMMGGSVDFTPGALRNGTKENWVECYQNPVSMGTRCHQLACYVVHDSPFTMLADAPTSYMREQECTDMIVSIPDVFDRTIIPQGRIGEYIVTARQHGDAWYVGGQTSWTERDVTIALDFLEPSRQYRCTLFADGINANHNAEDYTRHTLQVDSSTQLPIHMASGGGFLMSIVPM